MSEAELRNVNRIPPRMLVKAGSTLLVPRSPHRSEDVSVNVADSAMMLLAPEPAPGRRISFKAGKTGDSVAAVAKRYRVSADNVASWNGVSPQARFLPGQTIIVMQATPAAKAGKRSAPRAEPGARVQAKAQSTPARASSAVKPASNRSPSRVASSKSDSQL